MKNYDLLNDFNNETQNYLIKIDTIANFLYKNHDNIKIKRIGLNKKKEESKLYVNEILSISAFFALLDNDEFNSIFNLDFPLSDTLIMNDKLKNEFENIINSNNYHKIERININNLKKYIYNDLSINCNLNKNEINLNKINPFEIFSYFYDFDDNALYEFLINNLDITEDDLNLIFDDIDDLLDENKSYKINISKKDIKVFNGFIIYEKNSNYYLEFDDIENLDKNSILRIKRIRDNSEIDLSLLPKKLKIDYLNFNKFNFDTLDKYLNNNSFSFILSDKNDEYEIILSKINFEYFKSALNFKHLKILRDFEHKRKDKDYLLNYDFENSFIIIDDNKKELYRNIFIKPDTYYNDSYNKDNNTFDDSTLRKYGIELTEEKYVKDPSIAREDELKKIERILLYPEKDKSIILVGRGGCGKTSIVKGLAYRIKNKNVPNELKDLKIYSISTHTLVSNTKFVGELESKMQEILDEASQNKNILLFIDEIHQTMGAGKSENDENSVSEILKPYIDNGRVRVIGTTTTDEYYKYIESDEAYKSRFKKIEVKEPDRNVVYKIIDDLIKSYNKFNYSKFNFNENEKNIIINWLIDSTNDKFVRYDDKVGNPRLVLDILKYAYANANLENRNEVSINDLITALMDEDRLYNSSKLKQVKLLKPLLVQKHEVKKVEYIKPTLKIYK